MLRYPHRLRVSDRCLGNVAIQRSPANAEECVPLAQFLDPPPPRTTRQNTVAAVPAFLAPSQLSESRASLGIRLDLGLPIGATRLQCRPAASYADTTAVFPVNWREWSSMSYLTCCDLFRNSLSIEGKEGLSIVPVRHPQFGIFFRLEFCAVSKAEMQSVELPKDRRIILMVQQAIQCCPFCGIRLAVFYKDTFSNGTNLRS